MGKKSILRTKMCEADNCVGVYPISCPGDCQQNPQARCSGTHAQLQQEKDCVLMETPWVITFKEVQSSPLHTKRNVNTAEICS